MSDIVGGGGGGDRDRRSSRTFVSLRVRARQKRQQLRRRRGARREVMCIVPGGRADGWRGAVRNDRCVVRSSQECRVRRRAARDE